MSLNTIKINKDEIDDIIKSFNNCSNELEKYIIDIKTNLDKISLVWKGVDATKYIDKLSIDYVNDLTKIKDSIISFSDYLKEVNPKFTNLDNDFSRNITDIEV